MIENNEKSLQLARFWITLETIQKEIDNAALPLASYLDLSREDVHLVDALENCSKVIREHFNYYRLYAKPNEEK
jgi:hypothetical protein